MLGEIANTINDLKEKSMDAMLPKGLNEDFRKKMLEKAREMTPEELVEFGKHIEEKKKEIRERRMQKTRV